MECEIVRQIWLHTHCTLFAWWMTLIRTYPTYPPPSVPPQTQSCLDISGTWLAIDLLTTYFSDDRATSSDYVAFNFDKSDENSNCNYFGTEFIADDKDKKFDSSRQIALTTFPGYMGAKEGDNQFLSFAGPGNVAPGSIEVSPDGGSAVMFRDALCTDTVCTSKSVLHMVKLPSPVEDVGDKSYKGVCDPDWPSQSQDLCG